ncbi:hypothetical protein Tco_1011056 [Tanacetum coccineum]
MNTPYQLSEQKGLEYSDADIADFDERLERIYSREIHLVQVVDFQGMPELMRDGMFTRMVMKHHDDADLEREEMESPDLARYWSESERMIPGKGDLYDYWRGISTDGYFLGPPPYYTLIRDPMLRLCHRMMAHSIAGRSQAPEKVIVADLFYLRGLDVGSFVGRLAQHFRLLTAEILGGLTVITPELPIIDMDELPDVAVGTPTVAEDALAIDEGDQAVLAPVQAPQQPPPPPPAAARTTP